MKIQDLERQVQSQRAKRKIILAVIVTVIIVVGTAKV